MLSTLNNTKIGVISAFIGFGSFALADACTKWLGMHYETPHIIFWIYLTSVLFGLALSPFLGGIKQTLQTKKLPIHIARGVCAYAIAIFVVSALKELSLAMLYTILFLAPFLTTIAALPIFKEKVPLRSWIIIAIGFSGVLVAFRPDVTEISVEIIYAFAALMFIVTLSLLARPLDEDETLLSLSFFPCLLTVFLMGTSLLPNIPIPEIQHVPVFILGGLCVVLGLSGIAHGFRNAPVAIVAPIQYIQMIIALTIGYFIFDDTPDLWMLGGASIIIVSGLMLVLTSSNNQDAS